MIIKDLIRELEYFAAPELQEEYDNAGLIIGDSNITCTGALCTLDVTVEVVKEAKSKNCNLIVAHHPIIFRGIKKINGKSYVEKVVIEAIKNDIAIYASHTNLDNILLGVNGKIASRIGLKNISILSPKPGILRRLITFAPVDKAEQVRKAIFDAGAGHIGKYSECSFNSEGTGTFKADEGADPYVGEIGKQHKEKETKIEIVYPFYLEQQVVKALVDHHPYEEVAYDIFTMAPVANRSLRNLARPHLGGLLVNDVHHGEPAEELLWSPRTARRSPARCRSSHRRCRPERPPPPGRRRRRRPRAGVRRARAGSPVSPRCGSCSGPVRRPHRVPATEGRPSHPPCCQAASRGGAVASSARRCRGGSRCRSTVRVRRSAIGRARRRAGPLDSAGMDGLAVSDLVDSGGVEDF